MEYFLSNKLSECATMLIYTELLIVVNIKKYLQKRHYCSAVEVIGCVLCIYCPSPLKTLNLSNNSAHAVIISKL